MRNISYREFLRTVLDAKGPFSYRFDYMKLTVDPMIYIGIHWGPRAGRRKIEAALAQEVSR